MSLFIYFIYFFFFFFTSILYYMHYHGNWHVFSMTITLLWLSLLLFYSPHFFPFSTKTMEHSLFYYIICTTTNFLPHHLQSFLFFLLLLLLFFLLFVGSKRPRELPFLFLFFSTRLQLFSFLLFFIFWFQLYPRLTTKPFLFFIFSHLRSKICFSSIYF